MSYRRVLPRDLFNEAKLLKCLGQLALIAHNGVKWPLGVTAAERGFRIEQDENDGGLYVANLRVYAGRRRLTLRSNYNSKAPYPLSFHDDRFGTGPVFNDDGTLAPEFAAYLDCLGTGQ